MSALLAVLSIVVVVGCLGFLRSRETPDSAAIWFPVTSVLFVNLAFSVDYFSQPYPPSAVETGYVVTSLGLLMVCVGATFASAVTALPADSLSPPKRDNNAKLILIALTALFLAPSWLFYILQGSIPLFDGVSALLGGGAEQLGAMQASRLALDTYTGDTGEYLAGQGVLKVFRQFGVPLVSAVAILQIRAGESRPFRYVVLGLALLTTLAGGQRWPLMYLLGACLLALSSGARNLPWRKLLAVATSGLVVGVVVSTLQKRTSERFGDFSDALVFGARDLFNRILLDQSLVSRASYTSNSALLEDRGGGTYVQSLAAYLPGPGTSYSVDFYGIVTGDWHGFTAPPDFYTEAYINWGLSGVLFMSFAFGMLLTLLSRMGIRSSERVIPAAIRVVCLTGLIFISFSGLVFAMAILVVSIPAVVLHLLVRADHVEVASHDLTLSERNR